MERFCTSCGTIIVEGSRFCSNCGKQIKESSTDISDTEQNRQTVNRPIESKVAAESKESLIEELERLRIYFASREAQYNLRNKYINYLNTVTRPKVFAWIIAGGIISFVFYFIFYFITSIDTGSIGLFGVWIFVSIGGYIHFKNKTEQDIKNTQNALIKMENELKEYYDNARNCIIAFDYSEPAIIQNLIGVLINGRADSLKEAINVMLDDIHKQSMLAKQAEIAKNSKDIAKASETTSLLVGISLLSKRR